MQPSSSDYNPNYGAHGVWINYDEENESTHSHFHYSTIRGHYYSVHTAIKIKKRVPTQSLNTFDINLRVRGAKMFYDIDGVNFGKLVIRGQGLYMGYAEDPLFSLKNSGRIMYDVFVYDEGRKGYIEDCTDIQLIGWSKIHRYLIGEVPGLAKTMFVNTTFKDNNDVIQYTNRLPQEVIDNLKEALDK